MQAIESIKAFSLTSESFFFVTNVHPSAVSGFFDAFCEELNISVQIFEGEDGKFYLENNQ